LRKEKSILLLAIGVIIIVVAGGDRTLFDESSTNQGIRHSQFV